MLVSLNFKPQDSKKILATCRITDIPEAMFGNSQTHAGRLLFEDAVYHGNLGDLDTGASGNAEEKINAFENHIISQLSENKGMALWDIPRLREFKTMLMYENGVRQEERNTYMKIMPQNEFRERPVLPLPGDV